MNFSDLLSPQLVQLYVIVVLITTLLVHIAFAGAVFFDTVRTAMVPRWVWALATLLGGPIVGALYWIVHRGVPAAPPAPQAPLGPPGFFRQRPPTP